MLDHQQLWNKILYHRLHKESDIIIAHQKMTDIHDIWQVRNITICMAMHYYDLQHKNILFSGDFIGIKRERTKRSDTSKRHILARQKQIDSSEMHNNVSKTSFSEIRRWNNFKNIIYILLQQRGFFFQCKNIFKWISLKW